MISEELKMRLKDWYKGKKREPYKIILFPTGLCNLNCKFCKNKHQPENELSNDKWLELVREGIELGVEEWWITGGGEPFVKKDLTLNIIREIKDKNKFCDLMTNGTLLTDSILRKLVQFELDRILISLDGPSAKVNDKIRGQGVFYRVINSIKKLNYYKEKLNSTEPKIQISSVVNSYNYDKLYEMFSLVRELNVDELELHQMLIYDDTEKCVKDLILNERERKELEDILKKIGKIADNTSIDFNYDALNMENKHAESNDVSVENEEKFFCFQPFYTLLIDMTGEVAPCCPGGSSSKDVNIENRSMEDIWYGDYLNNIRNKIKRGNEMDFCKNCGVNNLREDVIRNFNG